VNRLSTVLNRLKWNKSANIGSLSLSFILAAYRSSDTSLKTGKRWARKVEMLTVSDKPARAAAAVARTYDEKRANQKEFEAMRSRQESQISP